MPSASEIELAGTLIKRAAQMLAEASAMERWEEARTLIKEAADLMRRAGSVLGGT